MDYLDLDDDEEYDARQNGYYYDNYFDKQIDDRLTEMDRNGETL